ncbi:hypothetical protein DFP72DRAFT_1105853, partial [Ephemerocybe angulata]
MFTTHTTTTRRPTRTYTTRMMCPETIVNGSAVDSSINGGSGRRPKPKKAATTIQSPREREHRSRTKLEKGSNASSFNGGAHKSTINSISTGERTRREGEGEPSIGVVLATTTTATEAKDEVPAVTSLKGIQNDRMHNPKPEYQEPQGIFRSWS